MSIDCYNCTNREICEVYKYFLTRVATTHLQTITATPDDFAEVIQSVRRSICNKCVYFALEKP